MIHLAIAFVVGGGIGFAAGRVKNSAKLAAISTELKKAETAVETDVKALIAKIKAKL